MIFECLGRTYFRRAYRMSYESFNLLHDKLQPGIEQAVNKKKKYKVKGVSNPPPVPNGRISTKVRLAAALRYFAGGSPYDIQCKYGLSHSETLESVWYVVDAVNAYKEFHIKYPTSHEKQKQIARQFKMASKAGFDNCAGTIDGILIWTQKPSTKDCARMRVGAKKFHCGRKNKFGLNCQAVSDVRGRIIDISIIYPAATSDCLAFEGSKLFADLEGGLLAEGLCLFGDNAYLNSKYMAVPFPGVSSGPRDDYNFFHSQLRIRVECAFGMLTERWGILRAAMPRGISIRKTCALVHALAKLHNFCIEQNDTRRTAPLDRDHSRLILSDGHVPLEHSTTSGTPLPLQLLNSGHHFDDVPRNVRHGQNNEAFPRIRLLQKVIDSLQVRPRERGGGRR